MDALKKQMQTLFVDKAPFQLPPKGREGLVKAMPWISLVVGILSLWAAWSLYRLMTVTGAWVNYANELQRAYGGPEVSTDIGLFGWASLGLLAVEGVVMLIAFPALKARKKSGWELLFWVALVNVGYAVVSLFRDAGGGVGSFIASIAGSIIGFYLLFQIRSAYDGMVAKKPTPPTPPVGTPPKTPATPAK